MARIAARRVPARTNARSAKPDSSIRGLAIASARARSRSLEWLTVRACVADFLPRGERDDTCRSCGRARRWRLRDARCVRAHRGRPSACSRSMPVDGLSGFARRWCRRTRDAKASYCGGCARAVGRASRLTASTITRTYVADDDVHRRCSRVLDLSAVDRVKRVARSGS